MKEQFKTIIQKTIVNEGYFSNDHNDRGGMTYMGISRKHHSSWEGWDIIDNYIKIFTGVENKKLNRIFKDDLKLTDMVYNFYYKNYFLKIKGDDIIEYLTTETIFDYAVNAGVYQSSKTVQDIVNCKADGIIGSISIKHINNYILEKGGLNFQIKFFIEKIKHYVSIVDRDISQLNFLFGWISRSFKILEEISNLSLSNNSNIKEIYELIVFGRETKNNRVGKHLELLYTKAKKLK